jgi:hypothetical protein
MPSLLASLQKQDLGHLRIVAELWGLELASGEVDAAAEELSASILDPEPVAELIESLPSEARAALDALIAKDGRLPWAEFTRRFGEVREMGAAKRDREQPHLHPVSPAETLYYRALLARAFFDTPGGPQEFAYIPEDLVMVIRRGNVEFKNGLQSLPTLESQRRESLDSTLSPEPPGRPATPAERGREILAHDYLLDDAVTLLAALRMGITPPAMIIPLNGVLDFLKAADLIKDDAPQPEPVRRFLEMPRAEAMKLLHDSWQTSESFNELRQLPGLVFEGEWGNQPLAARRFLLDLLEVIPKGKWWSLPAFVRAVKEKHADFQRPAGDYDSWFIKRASDGTYLRGFACWDEVDGALIKYFISGILHWLGMVDLSMPEGVKEPTAFHLAAPDVRISHPESGRIAITSSGRISVPRLAPRVVRYQVARFCEWDEPKADEYRYSITAASLARAKEQRLKVEQLLSLLAKHSAGIPPVLVKALKRWEVNGTEARVERQVVLRVSRPEVLDELRKSKAARFLGESLGPTSVIVKAGAVSQVMAALAELGLLAEDRSESL